MVTSLAADLEVARTVEPVVAWRTWTLTGRRDGSRVRLRPVAGRARAWQPLRPAEAVCKLARLHAAPNVDCTCGLHGVHDPDLLRRTKNPAVLGRVALWGRVIEHESGYRAEFGYPQRLRLVCQFCFWHAGTLDSAADVVGHYGRGRMLPLCVAHQAAASRFGIRPVSVMRAGAVEQRLRATYAVDPLAI